MSAVSEKRVLLAAPRGYCAGVDRAVITVEKALELYGAPVYVRKQIVHNKHVVATLEAKGAIFVEETDEVPEGKLVVFFCITSVKNYYAQTKEDLDKCSKKHDSLLRVNFQKTQQIDKLNSDIKRLNIFISNSKSGHNKLNQLEVLEKKLAKCSEETVSLKSEIDRLNGLLKTQNQTKSNNSTAVAKVSKSNFNTIKIGNQTWMSENLNVECFKNGDKIYEARTNEDWIRANEAGQPAWCYYDNDPLNGEIYGKLYNWYAVNDPRGLAPEGWFIPSDKEWNELTEFLDEYLAFDKLRAENVWEYHYNSTNESGFSALPGGGRDANGGFYFFDYGYNKEIEEEYFESRNELGKDAYWWSTSIDENNNVRCFELSDNYEGMHSISTDKGNGFSVRCLNNNFNKIEFVKIGNQKWMTENLNVDRFRNGDKIREARTNEEWELAGIRKLPVWCYANNDSKCDKLYNWYAVKDQRGLAPLGVKIPHNSDYLILIDFLGGEEIAGGKLQLVGYNPTIDDYEWNENGFQAISGHARFEFGHFVSSDIFFWSRTEKSIDQAGYFKIEKDGSKAQIGNTKKSTGYFVRCLKE